MSTNERPDPQSGDMAQIHDYKFDPDMDRVDKAAGFVFRMIGLAIIVAGLALFLIARFWG